MENELVLLSPEKTILSFRLAGVGHRTSAHLIDFFAILAFLFALYQILGATVSRVFPSATVGIMLVAASIGPFLYFILFEGLWNGSTLGKKLTGIRVRMSDGTPITFFAAIARNLARPGDFLPGFYFAGLLCIMSNMRSQRLGDMLANTIVIYEKVPKMNFAPAPHTAGTHYFESYVGDLRGMTQEEYLAVRRMCDRFPELPIDIQEKMIRDVWKPIASRRHVELPANVHPLYLAEATVMKYGRENGYL